jgi:SGNH domain-containing protein
MASAMAMAVVFVATDGLKERFPESVRRLASFKYRPDAPMRNGTCFVTRGFNDRPTLDKSCLLLDPSRRNVLLVGDSHAAHHWVGLATTFPDINFLQATASGCKPVLGGGGASRCRSVVDAAYLEFIPTHKLDAVIISAFWAAGDLPSLLKTIGEVQQHTRDVYVFGPIVIYDDGLPRLLARSEWLHDPSLVTRSRSINVSSLDRSFASAVKASGAKYVSIYTALCDSSESCLTRDDQGDPIQFDRIHLTKSGSILLSRILRERGLLR